VVDQQATSTQFGGDPRGAIDPADLAVEGADPVGQRGVGSGTHRPALGPGTPGVEPGAGDLEDPAQPLDAVDLVGRLVVGDERIAADRPISRAK
jgi:hypothetical protein